MARGLEVARARAARRGATAEGEAVAIDRLADNLPTLLHALVTRAIGAAIFDDAEGLRRHTASAMHLVPAFRGLYPTANAYLLRGLALAGASA